jgi:hypothetical protein
MSEALESLEQRLTKLEEKLREVDALAGATMMLLVKDVGERWSHQQINGWAARITKNLDEHIVSERGRAAQQVAIDQFTSALRRYVVKREAAGRRPAPD